MAYSPASNLVSNLPQATVIYYDRSFIDNLKANTPHLRVCARRDLPPNSGNQIELFRYNAFGPNTTQATEGTVGTGQTVSLQTTTATIGEYSDFATFSSLSLATAIDPLVENVAREFSYRLGQSIAKLILAVADSASTVDPSVSVQLAAASGTPPTYTPNTNGQLRISAMSLQGRNVLPIDGSNFAGLIHPFTLGDVLADSANNSPLDILKHTPQGLVRLDDLGSQDQVETVVFPSTGITFFKTTIVTQTSNYKSSGLTALRTYIFGNDAVIAINLGAKGDTALGNGEWKNLNCYVEQGAPRSIADPAGMIPAWISYRFHFTVSLPPDTVMRLRYIDAASGVS